MDRDQRKKNSKIWKERTKYGKIKKMVIKNYLLCVNIEIISERNPITIYDTLLPHILGLNIEHWT